MGLPNELCLDYFFIYFHQFSKLSRSMMISPSSLPPSLPFPLSLSQGIFLILASIDPILLSLKFTKQRSI